MLGLIRVCKYIAEYINHFVDRERNHIGVVDPKPSPILFSHWRKIKSHHVSHLLHRSEVSAYQDVSGSKYLEAGRPCRVK